MFDALISFALVCILVELTPGPNMAYLITLSAMQGKRAGFSMVAGIALGLLAVGVIAAVGVAALVVSQPHIYHFLRWTGVLYMVWLAWDSWRVPMSSQEQVSHFDVRYFRRGFITNILNPKGMIFYVTVLPTFIAANQPVMHSYLWMVVIYVLIATCVHAIIATLGGTMGFLQNNTALKLMRYIFTILLLGIAIWLAWATRLV